jgi:hypothetical protein
VETLLAARLLHGEKHLRFQSRSVAADIVLTLAQDKKDVFLVGAFLILDRLLTKEPSPPAFNQASSTSISKTFYGVRSTP